MIKKFESYINELDPYGEEDWNEDNTAPVRLEWNTEIEIGDELFFHYDRDGMPRRLGQVININKPKEGFEHEQDIYDLDTHRKVWKSLLIGAGARIRKGKLNESKYEDIDPYGEEDWSEDLIVDENTEIEAGDSVYDWNDKYMGKIINKSGLYYFLDNGKVIEKWALIYHKFRIRKKLNEGIRWWKDGKLGEEDPVNPIEEPIYDDILPDNGFRQFLIDNNCYEEFLHLCETIGHFKKKEDFYYHSRHRWLDVCFHWLKTGNGIFWSNMDNKWRKEINKYPPDMNEGIRWWKDGKLGEEEPDQKDFFDIERKYKVGDVISPKKNKSYKYTILGIDDDYIKLVGPSGSIKHWDMPSFKSTFEGVRWWKDGKLGEEEPMDEIKDDFKVGDIVITTEKIFYWANEHSFPHVGDGDAWSKYREPEEEFKIIKVDYCTDVYGYTGQIIKVDGRWPWYQITNFEKVVQNESVRWWKNGKLGEEEPMEIKPNDFITDDEFRQFLIDNECYDKYIRNVNNSFKNDMIRINRNIFQRQREDFINNAFGWEATPERSDFWEKMDIKWRRTLGIEEENYYYGDEYDDN